MGKQWKQCQTLFFWAPKSLQIVTAAMKLKDTYSLKGKAWKWKVKLKSFSHVWLVATPGTAAYQAPPSMGFFQARVLEWVPLPSPPYGASGKEPTCQCRRHKRHGYDPWVRKIPWRRKWQSTPICLPGKSRGQWRLAAIVHGVTKSQIWLKQLSMHTPTEMLLNIIQFHSKEWPGSKSQWCQG